MPLDPSFVGKKYGPYTYTLGLEKMREYTAAISGGTPMLGFAPPAPQTSPLLHDEAAAAAGPYGQVIGFPTFAVTFAILPFGAAVNDPELKVNVLMLVHGEQHFEFFDVMRVGDVMRTTGTLSRIFEKAGMDFMEVVTESTNQHGKLVVRGTWTAVIRR